MNNGAAYILLIVWLFINSCKGQANTNSVKDNTHTSQSHPEIIGTPPSSDSYTDPLNDPSLVGQYIRSIFQDSKGNYWFGPAGQSVARYGPSAPLSASKKTLTYYSKLEFFQGNDRVEHDIGNSVHAIAEDKKGNIWFGTDFGAIKYDGITFRTYDEKDGLSNIRVGRHSILVDKAGSIWVGTGGGVYRYNPVADSTGGKCFSPFHLLAPIIVKGIMEDNNGNIWFASQDNGVFRYDPSTMPRESGKAIKHFTDRESLGDNVAGGMAQDQRGNIWFTMKGGICRFDGKNFTDFTFKDGIGGSEVEGLYIEKSGIIWISARRSTTRYDPSIDISDPKAMTVFTTEDGINCCVQSMYQDKSGNMWWGTGQGLYRFDGTCFYQVKQNGPW